jgi:hypothetical protein
LDFSSFPSAIEYVASLVPHAVFHGYLVANNDSSFLYVNAKAVFSTAVVQLRALTDASLGLHLYQKWWHSRADGSLNAQAIYVVNQSRLIANSGRQLDTIEDFDTLKLLMEEWETALLNELLLQLSDAKAEGGR